MKKVLVIAIAAVLAAAASGVWTFEGQWSDKRPARLTVGRSGNVYVVALGVQFSIKYYTSTGSFLGQWGPFGQGNGEFDYPSGIATSSTGIVYVSDLWMHRIQFFTPTGSFLGKCGSQGSGNGQFYAPSGVAVAPNGAYVYVADTRNDRIQYFKWVNVAVSPASLGRVKAVFR